jgi:hypothetical protein
MRIPLLAAALWTALSPPALAGEGRQPEPVDIVHAFYAKDSVHAYELYSERLKKLFAADERRAGGGEGCLDFAFYVNGQDTVDGWEQTLHLESVRQTKARAEVKATFTSFGPQEIRYDLVREHGRWLIDDARSAVGVRWVLSRILRCAR